MSYPGKHNKGPIRSEKGFGVGTKTSHTEVIDGDAYIKSDRLRPDIIKVSTVTLSNAQVLALNTTAVELVAAPGAGKMIEHLGSVLKLNHGGDSNFAGDHALRIGIDDAAQHKVADIAHTAFHHKAADYIYIAQPALATDGTAAATLNKNLAIDAAGAITQAADNNNTITVTSAYRILDFS